MILSPATLLIPPPLKRADVVHEAEKLIDQYVDHLGWEAVVARGLSFDDVYHDVIYPQYEIELIEDEDLGTDPDGKKVLGSFDILSNTAYIDKSLRIGSGDPRRAFTCWHEVGGHGILQGAWLKGQLERGLCAEHLITTEASLSPATVNQLERQANLFAASASAPKWLVRAILVDIFSLNRLFRYAGPGGYNLYVHGKDVPCRVSSFDHLCQQIAKRIQHRFWGLSVESLTYRVKESGFVIETSASKVTLRRTASIRSVRNASGRPKRRARAGRMIGACAERLATVPVG